VAEAAFRNQASLLLAGLPQGREVRAYLEQFSAAGQGCFAVIKVGGALMGAELHVLADRLALLQGLGLRPVVVFGAGPQLDAALEAAGIGTERRDGLRVTPAEAMPLVAAETARTGLALVEAMRARGGHAVLTPPGTVLAELQDEDRYGRVGAVARVDADALRGLLASGVVPLIGCAHLDAQARLLNVNADDVARSVALALRPQKIVFLTGTGGLLDERGEIVSSINLATDEEALRGAPWLTGGMALKVRQISQLLAELPLSTSVSMTDADDLLSELFTHGGAGTLIRRGERILVEEEADAARLTPLIEEAFGRRLVPGYWSSLDDLAYTVRTENTRAGAVVRRTGGLDLLDKFAVAPSARGEGLAKAVWRVLRERSPRMVWRSRAENPFNAFYAAQADGFLRRGRWHVYWHGDADEAALAASRHLASRAPDFEDASGYGAGA
jgi:acetylglutamate kinase